MNYFLTIILPIILVLVGFYVSYKIHKNRLMIWKEEFKIEELLIVIISTFIKSIIIMTLIIIIHNTAHSDHYYELFLFVIVFFVFSIIQSSFSLGTFIVRFRNLKNTSVTYIKDRTKRADNFLHRLYNAVDGTQAVFFKIIVIFLFVIVFLPNIALFITTNLIYITLIIVFVILSLLLNNIIYFGIVSLLIFQSAPTSITFDNVNYLVLFSSYFVILLGLSLDNRLDSKMFSLIRVMEVKQFNFKLGYDLLKETRKTQVFQNQINKYFYVYYRQVGLVVVFHTDINVKLSNNMIRKLIAESKRFLLSHNEPVND